MKSTVSLAVINHNKPTANSAVTDYKHNQYCQVWPSARTRPTGRRPPFARPDGSNRSGSVNNKAALPTRAASAPSKRECTETIKRLTKHVHNNNKEEEEETNELEMRFSLESHQAQRVSTFLQKKK